MSSTHRYKVLVVDPDLHAGELLTRILSKEQFQITALAHGEKALGVATTWQPDLVLMEAVLPTVDALALGRQLKEHPVLSNTLLVYLTAFPDDATEIAAFDLGADGYLTKPLRPRALAGRIRAMLSRRDQQLGEVGQLVLGEFTLDKIAQKVYRGNTPVPIAQKEFDLLFFLAQHPNQIFSREALIREVWGAHVYVLDRTVDVHVHKIREKLGEDCISTVKGMGYRLNWKV